MNITVNNKKTTKTAGRPAIEGRRRQYVIADDAHKWIMDHGGGKYITETIRTIMAVSPEQKLNH